MKSQVLVPVLVIFLILAISTLILFAEEVKYDFRQTNWGMSVEQVELAEKGKITYRRDREGYTEYELTYEVKFGLYNYYCYYYFVEDKLYKCEYSDAESMFFDSSGFIAITEYKRFKKALIEKYGKLLYCYESNPYSSLSSTWNTPTTKIKLYYGSMFNSLSITYESRELKSWVDKILEEKTKIELLNLDKGVKESKVQEYRYAASKKSEVFHYINCFYVANIKPGNLILFKTRGEAIASGRRPCKKCKP